MFYNIKEARASNLGANVKRDYGCRSEINELSSSALEIRFEIPFFAFLCVILITNRPDVRLSTKILLGIIDIFFLKSRKNMRIYREYQKSIGAKLCDMWR
jgi:hypothetical protein